jgi:VWFA-related protein
MRARAPLTTAGIVVCLAVVAAAQQTSPPVFRSSIDAVELDVVVTNANGDPVNDLTAADFEIREQGKPQTLTSFTRIDIPIEPPQPPLFAGREISPDVRANDGAEGRVYVIAFDQVDPTHALRTRRFLRNFIEEQFGVNDTGAVVYLGRARSDDAQDLTGDRQLLLAAIDRFAPFPRNENGEQVIANTDAVAPASGLTPAQFEALNDQRQAMRSFRALTEAMSALRGRRKSLIYVSQGWQFDVFNVIDYNGGVLDLASEDAHAAIRAATRGNVTIYAIDPRGLTMDGGGGDTEAAPAVNALAGLQSRANLRRLAEMTGGFAFVNQNEFSRAFERIVRENSSYYLLGYSPLDERRDGRFRKLEVRVKRPGVQVRARSGYLAPRGTPRARPLINDETRLSAPVREALGSGVNSPGVPMRVFAAPYKGAAGQATVALVVETTAADLGLMPEGGSLTGELEVGFMASDTRNNVVPGRFHVAKLAMQGEGPAQARRTIRVVEELRLPAGRYQIRTALGNRAGAAGSVVYDVEVPDFTKDPLVLSGVSLMSELENGALNIRPNDTLRDLLPVPPTALREFAAADTVTVYAEVYDNIPSAPGHEVRIAAELRAEGGQVLQTVADDVTPEDLDAARGGYRFTAEIPLLDVEPGRYVVHIEARAGTGDRPAVARDILITVR